MAALGFGAAAAPVAGQMLAKSAMSAESIGSGANAGWYKVGKQVAWNAVEPTQPWTARGITKMFWEAMQHEAQEAREAVQSYYESGLQGNDPVAFVCKSWSPVFGNSFTRNKLKALQRRADELETKLWKDPE
jgi:hypothetical protein